MVTPCGRGAGTFCRSACPTADCGSAKIDVYTPPEGVFVRHAFSFGGKPRIWHGLAPRVGGVPPIAVVMLLHGSGRDGRAMLDMWQGVAREAGVLLIAPDALDASGWNPRTDGEAFLAQVMADAGVGAEVPVYLFGHSAGAEFALYLAEQALGPWCAAKRRPWRRQGMTRTWW